MAQWLVRVTDDPVVAGSNRTEATWKLWQLPSICGRIHCALTVGLEGQVPLCKGHPPYKATLALLKWSPYKRGTTVLHTLYAFLDCTRHAINKTADSGWRRTDRAFIRPKYTHMYEVYHITLIMVMSIVNEQGIQ